MDIGTPIVLGLAIYTVIGVIAFNRARWAEPFADGHPLLGQLVAVGVCALAILAQDLIVGPFSESASRFADGSPLAIAGFLLLPAGAGAVGGAIAGRYVNVPASVALALIGLALGWFAAMASGLLGGTDAMLWILVVGAWPTLLGAAVGGAVAGRGRARPAGTG